MSAMGGLRRAATRAAWRRSVATEDTGNTAPYGHGTSIRPAFGNDTMLISACVAREGREIQRDAGFSRRPGLRSA
jgi:hypothetical protein